MSEVAVSQGRWRKIRWNVTKLMLGAAVPPLVMMGWDAYRTIKEANLRIQAVKTHPQSIGLAMVRKEIGLVHQCPSSVKATISLPTHDLFRIYEVTGSVQILARRSAFGSGWANYSVLADSKLAGEVQVDCPVNGMPASESSREKIRLRHSLRRMFVALTG